MTTYAVTIAIDIEVDDDEDPQEVARRALIDVLSSRCDIEVLPYEHPTGLEQG